MHKSGCGDRLLCFPVYPGIFAEHEHGRLLANGIRRSAGEPPPDVAYKRQNHPEGEPAVYRRHRAEIGNGGRGNGLKIGCAAFRFGLGVEDVSHMNYATTRRPAIRPK